MPKLTNKTIVGIKTETTYNTGCAALAATDFLLAEGVELTPVGEQIKRDYKRGTLSKLTHLVGQKSYQVKFKTELKGSGSVGIIYAPLDAALQACGLSSTAVGGTSVIYAPVSTPVTGFPGPGKSATINVYRDGIKHVIGGCAGTVKISASKSGEPLMCEFDFKGLESDPTDTAFPTQTYLNVMPPKFESATITLMGLAATHIISKFDIDLGNTISMREDGTSAFGVNGFMITDRDPKGSCDPEAVAIATDSFIADFMAGTEAATSISVGATAGNIIAISCPKTQYSAAPYGDRSGILTHAINFDINQTSGDDELSITIT